MPRPLACLRVIALTLLAASPGAAVAEAGRICTARGRPTDEFGTSVSDQATASWMSFSPVAQSTT